MKDIDLQGGKESGFLGRKWLTLLVRVQFDRLTRLNLCKNGAMEVITGSSTYK